MAKHAGRLSDESAQIERKQGFHPMHPELMHHRGRHQRTGYWRVDWNLFTGLPVYSYGQLDQAYLEAMRTR